MVEVETSEGQRAVEAASLWGTGVEYGCDRVV